MAQSIARTLVAGPLVAATHVAANCALLACLMLAGTASGGEKLDWKFTEGEKLYYQLRYTEERTIDRLGEKSTETQEHTYWFSWHVESIDSDGHAWILVTFQRVRAESDSKYGKVAVDTDAPLSAREVSDVPDTEHNLRHAARALQDDAFRTLRSSFRFHVARHGGVPRNMKDVPPTITLPERFTTELMVKLSDRVVDAGAEWSVDVSVAGPRLARKGQSRYRAVEQVTVKGNPCWKIDNVIQYAWMTSTPGEMVESGPARGTYYFDSRLGLLRHGEQSIEYHIVSVETGRVSVEKKLNYTLLPRPPDPSSAIAERELADGKQIEVEYIGGAPALVDGEWANVVSARALLGSILKPRSGVPPQHQFRFVLELKSPSLKSISIYDVTSSGALLVARSDEPGEIGSDCEIFSDLVALSEPGTQWLRTDEVTEWIFKIVLENKAGKKETLYQPVVLHTGAVRDYLRDRKLLPPIRGRK
jgi:hypothetical protein